MHASVACRRKLVVDWVPSSDLEETAAKEVCPFYSLSSYVGLFYYSCWIGLSILQFKQSCALLFIIHVGFFVAKS